MAQKLDFTILTASPDDLSLSPEDRKRLIFGDWSPGLPVIVRNTIGNPGNGWLGIELEANLTKGKDSREIYSQVLQLVNPKLVPYRQPFRIVRPTQTFERKGFSKPEIEAVLEAYELWKQKQEIKEKGSQGKKSRRPMYRPRRPKA